MPETHVLLLYLAALAAVFLAPGPDMALLLATAAGRGTRAGLRTALGFAAARYCHCLAAGLGLAALFAAHPPLQSAVRAGGAAYLLWLAWKALRAGKQSQDGATRREPLPAADAADVRNTHERSAPADPLPASGPATPTRKAAPARAAIGAAAARADVLRCPEPPQPNPSARPEGPGESIQTVRAGRAPSATPRNGNAPSGRGETPRPGATTAPAERKSPGKVRTPGNLWPDFSRGLLTNLLNPKALLFCGLFLPQFVSGARGALLPQFLLLGAMLVAVGFAFDAAYAFMAGGLPELLRRRRGPAARNAGESWSGRARRWLMGSVFAVLAARLVAG